MSSQCIFCKTDLNKSTKSNEHIVPQWLLRHLEMERDGMTIANVIVEGESATIDHETQRDLTFSRYVYGRVCKTCNSGWMSDLETKVKPILVKVLDAERQIILSNQDCELLASWLFKTFILIDALSISSSLLDAKKIEVYFKTRQAPKNISFFLSYLSDPNNEPYFKRDRIRQGVDRLITPPGSYVGLQEAFDTSYKCLFRFGSILAQIVQFNYPGAKFYVPETVKHLYPNGSSFSIDPRIDVSDSFFDADLLSAISVTPTGQHLEEYLAKNIYQRRNYNKDTDE